MQTLTQPSPAAQLRPQAAPIDERIHELATQARQLKAAADLWLDTRSTHYSRMLEESVSRRTVLRVNLITLCLVVAALCAAQDFLVTGVAATVAAWLTYRLNKTDQAQQKKGGRR